MIAAAKQSKDCASFGHGTKDFASFREERSIFLALVPQKKDFGPLSCSWEEVDIRDKTETIRQNIVAICTAEEAFEKFPSLKKRL